MREDLKLTRRSIGWQIADQFAGAFPPGWCLRPDKTTAVWSAPPLAVSTGETRVSPPGFRCELRSRHPYRVEVHADQPAQSLQRAPLPGASFCACAASPVTAILRARHRVGGRRGVTWMPVCKILRTRLDAALRWLWLIFLDRSRRAFAILRQMAALTTPSGLSDLR